MKSEAASLFDHEPLKNYKPTIVYLKGNDYSNSDPNEDVIVSSLKQNFGLQVITNIHAQQKEFQFLLSTGSVIGFLVAETGEDYYNPDSAQESVSYIREISSDLPIFLIPCELEKLRYQSVSQDKLVTIAYRGEKQALELIKEHIEKFVPKSATYGVETIDNTEPMAKRILRSYENSDHDNGASSPNDQIIIQAINVRICPTDLSLISIKSIFEDNLQETDLNYLKTTTPEEIEKQKQYIRNLSEYGKEQFVSVVRKSKYIDKNGRYDLTVVNMGDYVNGFAIDPETMEFIVTGSGDHQRTKKKLVGRIIDSHELCGQKNVYDQEDSIHQRLVSGYIYPHVPDFSTPILVTDFFDYYKSKYKKVIEFLTHQNFIAIDEGGNLIE